jgi:hypothetical protein
MAEGNLDKAQAVRKDEGIHTAGPSYPPVAGKTYSLFGSAPTTEPYYEQVRRLADEILRLVPGEESVLALLQKAVRRRRTLARAARRDDGTALSAILRRLRGALSPYTANVRPHLGSLPKLSCTDRRLRLTEEQYHLHMVEIELMNRANLDRFLQCDLRIALLPHCLRDFHNGCRAEPGDIETVCAGCSGECYIHRASALLRKRGVHPYIWTNAKLGSLFRQLRGEKTLGVLGIACIPELAWGMRACLKRKIPVVGVPLDANRCMRWMGRFHENSVNLQRLDELLNGPIPAAGSTSAPSQAGSREIHSSCRNPDRRFPEGAWEFLRGSPFPVSSNGGSPCDDPMRSASKRSEILKEGGP